MSNTFLIGCTHFGHANMYTKFVDDEGNPVRPEFKSAEEADEAMVERWNSVVRPKDRVYHLGDVAVPRKSLQILDRLNGRLVLIKGNHDIFKLSDYSRFDDIRAVHKLDKFYLSHIPMHVDSIPHWCQGNIHAHTHLRRVKKDGQLDHRYFSVSVEWIDYTPIEFSELKERME